MDHDQEANKAVLVYPNPSKLKIIFKDMSVDICKIINSPWGLILVVGVASFWTIPSQNFDLSLIRRQ